MVLSERFKALARLVRLNGLRSARACRLSHSGNSSTPMNPAWTLAGNASVPTIRTTESQAPLWRLLIWGCRKYAYAMDLEKREQVYIKNYNGLGLRSFYDEMHAEETLKPDRVPLLRSLWHSISAAAACRAAATRTTWPSCGVEWVGENLILEPASKAAGHKVSLDKRGCRQHQRVWPSGNCGAVF